MFQNYLKIALRNLWRHPGYTLINILGLAIGMASCILILALIQDEMGYERHHEKADRIYRVLREFRTAGAKPFTSQGTSGALQAAIKQDFPEVTHASRWMSMRPYIHDPVTNKGFFRNIRTVDLEVFDVFTIPFIQGDPTTALNEPGTIVITEETAQLYFGDEDPIGKTLSASFRYVAGDYRVTGIIANSPKHTDYQYDMITTTIAEFPSTFWDEWSTTSTFLPFQTLIVLAEGADARALEQKLPAFMARYMGKTTQEQNTYKLQPLKRIHLYSRVDYDIQRNSDIQYIYLYGTIATFILLIACVNFMNLATARSSRRSREVGLRKVVGAYRAQLVTQFMGEALMLSALALGIGILLAHFTMPIFNTFINKQLTLTLVDPWMIVGLAALTLCVGILAGSYPALFLAGFRPVTVLKGTLKIGGVHSHLRKGLVVFQFAVSILLVIGAVVVRNQLDYIQNKNLGFNQEQLLTTGIFSADRSLTNQYETVKQEFLQHPNILKASASHSMAGRVFERMHVTPEGFPPGEWQFPILGVDEDFLDVYEVDLIQGRFLSRDFATDSTDAFILNETAVKQFGWKDPIGKTFEWPHWERKGRVVGVVKDFHFQSLRTAIGPLVICKWQDKFNRLTLKVKTENFHETRAFMESKWKQFIPNQPFSFIFVDQLLQFYYQEEQKLGDIFRWFSGLAIFVGCLGLLGLVSFTAEQRTKEIGVRKTLGATVPNIIVLLSREFLKLVLIANIVAWPLAYYLLNDWLQNFVYRTDLNLFPFLLGGFLALLIAQLTVSYQAIRSALSNPIDALRYE